LDKRFDVTFDEHKIDAIFAQFDQCQLPGVALGIAIRGEPVYRKGFGLANMELPVLLSPSIRMRIGSTTKHFACLAYLLLCEAGEAEIDAPIGKYIPELHPVARGVTTRQLMGNVSGLRDVFDITWQFSGTPRVSSEQLLAMYRDIDDVNAPPGTNWIYNNGGFLMLSVAIERISGRTLEEFLRERIFDPIGMYETLLRRSESGFVPNSAALHTKNGGSEYQRSPFFGTDFAGEGGIVSTVDDMLRWLAHMDSPVVGNASTWAAMKTPQHLANGTSSYYSFGLLIDRYRGLDIIHHPGGGMGGNAQMIKVPAAGLDVIVMVNRDESGWALGNQILDSCVTGLDPVPQPSAAPFATGTFRSATTGRVVQLCVQDGQQILSIDGNDMPASADSEGVLWPIQAEAKQSVTLLGDLQTPSAVRLSDFGNADELGRESSPPATDMEDIIGRYRADSIGAEVTIAKTPEGARMSTVGKFGSRVYALECLADGVWRAKRSWMSPRSGGVLSFDRERRTFSFSGYRTWRLTFRRADGFSGG